MIKLTDVSFSYRRKKELFTNFSVELTPGHVHGLLGSNGTGKSTLLKIICGLLDPYSGNVEVMTYKPSRRQPALYRELFIVPEEFDLPAVSFRDYVRINKSFYPNFSQEALDLYVHEFEIDPRVGLDQISMGQKKRAQIAFALACNTPILIMDEPTNGLDIPAKGVFRRLVASYADPQRTVIISTHQVRDVENLIDNVVIIDSQGIVLNRTTEQIESKLYFGPVKADDPGMLYGEEGLHGWCGVAENPDERPSKIDLELLFNAALRQRDRIDSVLNR